MEKSASPAHKPAPRRPRLQVYLDLDGVFADFDARVKHLCGKHPNQLDRSRLWKMINSDKRFFAELELIEGCMLLWQATRDLEPIFLTGAPSSRVFQEQKREWVARIFGPEFTVHVVPKRLKQEYSGPHKVLIDDTPENIAQWQARGGYGILHKGDHASTVKALQELLDLYAEEERSRG
jgi:5' nucleotidase, deoxy (Pyrimidine), cytosolic type C protein (NT5C)